MVETILLVDDEEGIRTVLGITLAERGYEVLTAASGEEALRLFEARRPAIILTDIKMPGLSGLDLLKRVKTSSPDTEVIMITGHGDMDLAIQSLKHDATDFVTKPIDDDILEIALKRATERLSMRRQLREHTVHLERLVEEKSARLVEAERQLAALQVVEELSAVIRTLVNAVEDGSNFFSEMPCFIAIHTRDLKIIATNQLYKKRLGSRVGANSWEAYTGLENQRSDCPVFKTIETDRGQRTRETVIDKLGQEIPVLVHTSPIHNNEGEVELVLEVSVDVSEVKRLQEELKSTRARYQQLFDEAPCYISVLDRQFGLLEANRRFKDGFGTESGAPCYEVFRHRSALCPDCPAEKTFQDGLSHQIETVVTSMDGEQRNVLVWTAPIADGSGSVGQVMELSTDITQIRKLQDRLSSLGLLLGSTAHGIKGLLTALDGSIFRLEHGLKDGNRVWIDDGFADVQHLVGRIKHMVLDILYYAKKRDLTWKRLDVRAFAEEISGIVEPKASAKGIAFRREFEEALGEFEADEDAVLPALVNILENGVDACVADRSKPGHTIVFGARRLDGVVEFHISDNGVGMDRETRERLFTLFFSSKGPSGTGIGLFVANQVIQQHGGRILVESAPGRGTTFTIRLPRELPAEVKAKPAEPAAKDWRPPRESAV